MRTQSIAPQFGAMIPISQAHIPTELPRPATDWRTLLNGAEILVDNLTNPKIPKDVFEKTVRELKKADPDFDPADGVMIMHVPDMAQMYMGYPGGPGKVYLVTGEDIPRAKALIASALQDQVVDTLDEEFSELREQNFMDRLELDVSKAQGEAAEALKRAPGVKVTAPIIPEFVDPLDYGEYELVRIIEDDRQLWQDRLLSVLDQVAKKAGLQGIASAIAQRTEQLEETKAEA